MKRMNYPFGKGMQEQKEHLPRMVDAFLYVRHEVPDMRYLGINVKLIK